MQEWCGAPVLVSAVLRYLCFCLLSLALFFLLLAFFDLGKVCRIGVLHTAQHSTAQRDTADGGQEGRSSQGGDDVRRNAQRDGPSFMLQVLAWYVCRTDGETSESHRRAEEGGSVRLRAEDE